MSPQSRCTSFVLNRVTPAGKGGKTTNARAAQYRGTLIGDSRVTEGVGELPGGGRAFSESIIADIPPLAKGSLACAVRPRWPRGDLRPTGAADPSSAPSVALRGPAVVTRKSDAWLGPQRYSTRTSARTVPFTGAPRPRRREGRPSVSRT